MRLPAELTLPDGMVPERPPDPPATPRDAATVVLLRDGPGGPEVFLQRRVRGMPFAGGMTAFPGGGVDERDSDTSIAWAGPSPGWWATRFGCDEQRARSLVCAAVRETFEESGVLLAGETHESVVSEATRYAEERRALVAKELSLAGMLAEHGLVLRADLLRPWSNWVTPAVEPRRYDTRFFLTSVPEGQRADGFTGEAAEAYWRLPAEALDDWRSGECGLLPPTWVTLTELAGCSDVAGALTADRELDKIIPKVVHRDGAWRVVLPREDQ
ncbi:8-oxo-dGTP pyrophosphatase MutT (NUDIX family) [Actinopolyspora biskrensis]|uniref:8-oxo-dGTP pyrophosphatase MutT (NUDIX family) n=1 Tax=Actinopolyspora biskrensis TaxID=1470178 RepID=A0A852ZAB9_9ACTN|nr:NUDIX domain-containing protein [Actinopolyspora biskrensis]NYH80476.1 8-oxo-dGTP pyrophosphatase MutT (NUDIX family) [Actinopolyspora biskrensis]